MTSNTYSPTITQQSFSVLCLATSAGVNDLDPPELAPDDPELYAESPEELSERMATFPPFYTSRRLSIVLVSKYEQAAFPESLPYTTQSNKELPPSLLIPCTPPHTSPVAYNPAIGYPVVATIWDPGLIFIPPMQ